MSSAINAASITSVPEPHIGSTTERARPPRPSRASRCAIARRPRDSPSAARRRERDTPRRCRLSPERSMLSVARRGRDARPDARPARASSTEGRCPSALAELVDDRILGLQCAEVRVIDSRTGCSPKSIASVPSRRGAASNRSTRRRRTGLQACAAGNFPSGMRMRLAVRDHRHARYAVSSVPAHSTPRAMTLTSARAERRELGGREIGRAGRAR